MTVLTFVLSQCFIVKLLTKPILLRILILSCFIYVWGKRDWFSVNINNCLRSVPKIL